MRKSIVYWINKDEDWQLILKIRSFGLTKLAQATGINMPTISRWLREDIGMKEEWYRKIRAAVKHTLISDRFVHVRYGEGGYLRPWPPKRT